MNKHRPACSDGTETAGKLQQRAQQGSLRNQAPFARTPVNAKHEGRHVRPTAPSMRAQTVSPISNGNFGSRSLRRSAQNARLSNANETGVSSWIGNLDRDVQSAATNFQDAHGFLLAPQTSGFRQEQFDVDNFNGDVSEPRQDWLQSGNWNIDPSLTGESGSTMHQIAMPAPSQNVVFGSGYSEALQASTINWSFESHPGHASSMEQFGMTAGPSDNHLQIAASVPQSQPGSFNSGAETPPEILSSVVTNNYNYQEGMVQETVGNMRGWIGRAPMTGERAIPRLDTNHLAPPDHTSANRSPTSASTTGSSSRRRKPWEMQTGDFICGYCHAGFPTQGDLTHHLRSHTPYMSRQHVCTKCEKRFQYRKDLQRHLPRHDPNRKKFYCPFQTCKYHAKGFGRDDHLQRHLLSQHRADTPLRMASRSPSNRRCVMD